MRVVGLMSGTSLDGIDVALVDIDRSQDGRFRVDLHHHATFAYGDALRNTLVENLPPEQGSTACVAELNRAVGEAFADATLRALARWNVAAKTVHLIGSHGHTLYHAPGDGVTMQIGEPAVIAARTGITCVADFRAADVALGGHGAPLVPFFDHALFADASEYRAALNIGGIANLTLLPSTEASAVRAFDTGPGNMVIDQCARDAAGVPFDGGGRMAAAGAVHGGLLQELLAHPYFAAPPPKSTGREAFGRSYASEAAARGKTLGLGPDDLIATVTALTAHTIAAVVPRDCRSIIVSGGGAHNATLMRMLRDRLTPDGPDIRPSDDFGVPVDAKEAMAFALLAHEAYAGRSNHLPQCTGASRRTVLGKIVPGGASSGT